MSEQEAVEQLDAENETENETGKTKEEQALIDSLGELGKHVEIRTLQGKDDESHLFPFIVIDSAEKWELARNRKLDFDLTSPNSNKSFSFELFGVSFSGWSKIEEETKDPSSALTDSEEDMSELEKEEALAKSEDLADLRRLKVLEVSTGNELPGDSDREKLEWLRKRNSGEIKALFEFIQYEVCGLVNIDPTMLAEYNRLCLEFKQKVSVNSFSDWDDSSSYTFRLQRPQDPYILEIPLNNITGGFIKEVEKRYKVPAPPKMPKFDKETKRFDPRESVSNFDDPAWMAKAERLSKAKDIAILQEALTFDIPGDADHEKAEWIGDRLVGDVVKIRNFIDSEIISSRGRYDFFTDHYNLGR